MDGFNYDASKEIEFCESCADGKHHRQKFPKGVGKRSTEILGLVHSDVCGQMGAKSLSGCEYFLTFIDDKSRYTWIYVLKRKSEVFNKFIEWKTMVERFSGQNLKAFRTGNGGEYTSKEYEDYLKKEGIRNEFSIPKTPEQNGVAERMNRTLVESVRSMLSDAKLPKRFWAEDLSTATYFRNRSPTKAVIGMTPYEAWTVEKPNVKHLQVFGSFGYAYVPKYERSKLDSKVRKFILLGYDTETKGYRLYDPKIGKVFFSRDVIFNDVKFNEGEESMKIEDIEMIPKIELINQESYDEESDVQTDPDVCRPSRMRKPPNNYGDWVNTANETNLKMPKKMAISTSLENLIILHQKKPLRPICVFEANNGLQACQNVLGFNPLESTLWKKDLFSFLFNLTT